MVISATPLVTLVFCVALLFPTRTASAGKLDRVRDATESRNDDDHRDSSSDEGSDDDDDDDESLLGAFLRALLFGPDDPGAATSRSRCDGETPRTPFFLPHFTLYPYAEGHSGNMFFRRPAPQATMVPIRCPPQDPFCDAADTCVAGTCYAEVEPAEDETRGPRAATGRFQLNSEFGSDVDGIFRQRHGLWLESTAPVGIQLRASHLLESLPDGSDDELFLTDGHLFFRVATLNSWQAHVGAGVRLLLDPRGGEPTPGFGGLVSVEGYPAAPLTVRGRIDAGNLGPALFLEGEANVGVMLKRLELFAGYNAMRISPVVFHGPLLGLRVHL